MQRPQLSERIYAAFLVAYPRRFRRAFAPELLAFFRDDRERARRRGSLATAGMWARTLDDLIRSAWRQRVVAARSAANASPPPTAPRRRAPMSDLLQDLRYGLRALARDPGFALVAILTLALGVGATTGVFSVIDGVLLRPLPYPDPDELVFVGSRFDQNPDDLSVLSEGNLAGLAESATTLAAVAGVNDASFTVLGDSDPELVAGALVGRDFFPMLGVEPAIGRGFTETDFAADATGVVLLAHRFWQERFAGDPQVLGATITLDRQPYTVIGVVPRDFYPPEALDGQADARLWTPLRIADPPVRTSYGYQALARLAPGATVASASAEVDRILRSETEIHGLDWEVGGGVMSLRERTLQSSGEALWLLLLSVGFLLLIACANVANLMLARGTRRGLELAVRRSLGAGRWRIARQLLTESVVLALIAGLAGALLSYWAVRLFKIASPGGIPRLAEVSVDLRVLLAALALSTAVGLLFGLAPALQGFGGDTRAGLRLAASTVRGSTAGRRTRGLLVVAETALALILLIGAALLLNSFARMSRVERGFVADGLATMRVNLRTAYPERDTWLPLFRSLLEEVEAIPGVRSASLTTSLPFAGIGIMTQVTPLDTAAGQDELTFIASTYMSRGHFRNMGMTLLEGRELDASDQGRGQVIVNSALVEAYWPDAPSALGKRIRLGDEPDDEVATVVGVVNSLRYRHDQEQPPEMYFDMDGQAWRSMWVIARTDGEAAALARPLRDALWRIDRDLPIDRAATVSELAWNSVGQPRFYTGLAATLALIALALALVGIYGTLSYTVGSRVRELGIRMALGARPAGVVSLVLRGGLGLTALGVAVGAVGAVAATRLMESFLFGVTATDLPTFAVAVLLFIATASLACWIPARRAARLDPVTALRS